MSTPPTIGSVNFSILLRVTEGLTQWRPIALGFLTVIATGILFAIGGMLASSMGGIGGMIVSFLFAGVLGLLVMAAGMSGVGILLMDKARNLEPRPMLQAWLAGLMCLPKLIGFQLVASLAIGALALVATLVYFLCKIPFLGPVLMFVAHPIMVLVAAALFTSMFWVAFPLFAPAVWAGCSFKEALTNVTTIARTRLLHTVLLFIALYFLLGLIGMLVMAAILPGYTFMTMLATGITGGEDILAGLFSGMGSGRGFSGTVMAGVLASALIFGMLFVLLMQTALMGLNLVYLSVSEGLDSTSTHNTDQALSAWWAQAKEKAHQAKEKTRQAAEAAQEKARQAAEQAKERARQRAEEQAAQQAAAQAAAEQAATAQAAAQEAARQQAAEEAAAAQAAAEAQAAAQAPACPQCHNPVGADDTFCGECGQRVKD